MQLRTFAAGLGLLSIVAVGAYRLAGMPPLAEWKPLQENARKPSSDAADVYTSRVKPILDGRCVVCHSCYNAPCQLKLASPEGLARGATKAMVYGDREEPREPTRLYTDARSAEEWRQKGFFPVVSENGGTHGDRLRDSLLYQMIVLNKDGKTIAGGSFKSRYDNQCPANEAEFREYARANPNGGMPFGFPSLSHSEFDEIQDWIEKGAPGPMAEPVDASLEERVRSWEELFNRPDPKSRLVARYLYEHLFLGHLHFPERPGTFFMLVRSRTPAPEPIVEVNTRRPYDDPGGAFHYRLRKVAETIVHKNHIPYELSEKRRRRIVELFFLNNGQGDWSAPSTGPDYTEETGSNPFRVFESIPARARYQFMLDDAQFFLMSFIKGPVCFGNIALNVINDHFRVYFLDPKADGMSVAPQYFRDAPERLEMPTKGENSFIESFYPAYKAKQTRYAKQRKMFYHDVVRRGMRLDDIWNGLEGNTGGVFTIFRHVDSASVERGALGGITKTAFVLDYSIFERIYYSLVVGFDVYGNTNHQAVTRLYMDNLRVEGEDLFLAFLPGKTRDSLRKAWYKGTLARLKMYALNPYSGSPLEPEIQFRTADPKSELFSRIQTEVLHAAATPEDDLSLSARGGPFTRQFPPLSLLHVTGDGGERVYSIIRNDDYENISFAFWEDERRNPEGDTLSIVPGIRGSYPNLFFAVESGRVTEFLRELEGLDGSAVTFSEFVSKHGVSRADPRFWERSDAISRWFAAQTPLEAGLLDLSRYENR